MADENNNPKKNQQHADRQDEVRQSASLTRGDILSDDVLHLSTVPQQADYAVSGNAVPAPAAALQLEDLLSSIDSHPSLAGGVLTFDSESNPGHTIVRVMLDDNGAQQAVEVGVFNGVGMDLNSLLGLITQHHDDQS